MNQNYFHGPLVSPNSCINKTVTVSCPQRPSLYSSALKKAKLSIGVLGQQAQIQLGCSVQCNPHSNAGSLLEPTHSKDTTRGHYSTGHFLERHRHGSTVYGWHKASHTLQYLSPRRITVGIKFKSYLTSQEWMLNSLCKSPLVRWNTRTEPLLVPIKSDKKKNRLVLFLSSVFW